jgi:Flp pilus assembly protein TadG
MRRLRTLARERRAVAMVEAALIFPLMATMLLGTFELSQYVRATGRVTDAANAIADLVAQQSAAITGGSTGVLGSFCKAGKFVMTPFATAGTAGQVGAFAAAIASVTNNAGTAAVNWESDAACGISATALGATAVSLATSPANMVPNASDSVIVVKVTYLYKGVTQSILPGTFTLSQIALARPRSGTTVSCTAPCS